MPDERLILELERLREDLATFSSDIRRRYATRQRPVVAGDLRDRAVELGETWMVTAANHPDVLQAMDSDYLADLNVRFQRLLRYGEHATQRGQYEAEVRAILQGFRVRVIVPLKQLRTSAPTAALPKTPFLATAFVGHSFEPEDAPVAECVIATLRALGIEVLTGSPPRANRISDKVKGLIDQQYFYVGVFTRRDKLADREEWATSPWVIDEKAYAVGKGKKLVLLREEGVASIGGIQGDYEFIPFSRDHLGEIPPALVSVFVVSVIDFK